LKPLSAAAVAFTREAVPLVAKWIINVAKSIGRMAGLAALSTVSAVAARSHGL
jgi:hypothetical protein